jgi:hypothetical protein
MMRAPASSNGRTSAFEAANRGSTPRAGTMEYHFTEVARVHALKREIEATTRAHAAGELTATDAAMRLVAIIHWLDETPATTQH